MGNEAYIVYRGLTQCQNKASVKVGVNYALQNAVSAQCRGYKMITKGFTFQGLN